MDYNSIKNQEIKAEFVKREVGHCISSLISLNYDVSYDNMMHPDNWENIKLNICPDCGKEPEDWGVCPEHGEFETYQEIYEYWTVNTWLGEKLKEKGEPVLYLGTCFIWGRTCTGQAIFLDSVISQICYDLGILESQIKEYLKENKIK